MKSLLLGAISAGLLAAASLADPAAARAGHDTKPPALDTPVKAQFVVGAKLDQWRDAQEGHAYYNVPMRLSWSGTDNVDTQLNYDVWDYPEGAPPDRIGDFITATTFAVTGSDYVGFFGGADLVIDHWGVQAYDDSGNSSTRAVYGAQLLVTQDNGSQTYGSESTDVSVAYTGSWAVARCSCYADRTSHHSNTAGDAVVITVVVPPAEDLRRVALVLDQGPNRGRARIRVDGELRDTVDTQTATDTHKEVVWTGTLKPGTHTVTVVNRATAGRPRIDFDAVVVN
jgi:hypothetical protein